MKRFVACLILSLAGVALAPRIAVADVPAADTAVSITTTEHLSPQFLEVARHLDLGGIHYTYMQTDGFIEEISGAINQLIALMQDIEPTAVPVRIDLDIIMKHLGLFNLDAYGTSTVVEDGEVYHNKAFYSFPEGRTGIFNVIGEEPHPLNYLDLAGAGTDAFFSTDLRLSGVVPMVRGAVEQLMGEQGLAMLEFGLGQPVPPLGMAIGDILAKMDTEVAFILDLGEMVEVRLPDSEDTVELPTVRGLLVLDDMGWLLTRLMQLPEMRMLFTVSERNGLTYLVPAVPEDMLATPVGTFDPLIILNNETQEVFLTSHRAFYETALEGNGGLIDTEGFATATEGFPVEANALAYVSANAFSVLADMFAASPEERAELDDTEATIQAFLDLYVLAFPFLDPDKPKAPAASFLVASQTGIFVESRVPFATNPVASSMSGGSPIVVGGLLASMAIPAFEKVRETSREKAIVNNLRQIASAADQYMLETGNNTVNVGADLIGPDKYIRSIESVAGETYDDIELKAGFTSISVVTEGGEIITFEY